MPANKNLATVGNGNRAARRPSHDAWAVSATRVIVAWDVDAWFARFLLLLLLNRTILVPALIHAITYTCGARALSLGAQRLRNHSFDFFVAKEQQLWLTVHVAGVTCAVS